MSKKSSSLLSFFLACILAAAIGCDAPGAGAVGVSGKADQEWKSYERDYRFSLRREAAIQELDATTVSRIEVTAVPDDMTRITTLQITGTPAVITGQRGPYGLRIAPCTDCGTWSSNPGVPKDRFAIFYRARDRGRWIGPIALRGMVQVYQSGGYRDAMEATWNAFSEAHIFPGGELIGFKARGAHKDRIVGQLPRELLGDYHGYEIGFLPYPWQLAADQELTGTPTAGYSYKLTGFPVEAAVR